MSCRRCELVGLLYATCLAHHKRARWARQQRLYQVARLRSRFKGAPVGVRYLSRDELVRLSAQLVAREARIQGRAGRIIPKRCEP